MLKKCGCICINNCQNKCRCQCNNCPLYEVSVVSESKATTSVGTVVTATASATVISQNKKEAKKEAKKISKNQSMIEA